MNEIFTTELAEHAENEDSAHTGKIIGAAIDVHRALGPGLLESAYEACLIAPTKNEGGKSEGDAFVL
jgi:hypothetical protein